MHWHERGSSLIGSPTVEIALLCLVVFALQVLVRATLGPGAMIGLFALASPLAVAPWTFVTSVYAHATVGHLAGNLLLLLLIGLPLERLTTSRRFHLFFLLTGMTAGVFQILVTTTFHEVPFVGSGGTPAVLGASGAIFALLGYVITGNRVVNQLLDRVALPARFQLAVLVVVALVVTFTTADSPRVAIWGHFSGLLLGLLAGRTNLLRVR